MADAPENLAERLVALEKSVDVIQRDLAELRTQMAVGERRSPAPREEVNSVHRAAAPVVEATPARRGLDFETLVGRYGMLALATVLALTAVGTFVGWAIRHGLLGPIPRIALGLAAAAAVGTWGFHLRPRERSFGDSLLGLSLAIVHVCAWAAGPGLHVVPPFLALALSAVASVGLAGYALVHDDEPLWCVGFGGAAIAPFVTSTGQGTAPMLAAYAAAVLIAAGSALASRPWVIAARVFGAAALLFVGAIMVLPASQHSSELALALPFAVAALGVLPFAHGAAIRPRLRTLGLLAGAAALNLAAPHFFSRTVGAIALGLAGLAWLALVELTDSEPAGTLFDGLGDTRPEKPEWLDGALIPCAFLGAFWLLLHPTDGATAVFALAAAALVFWCSRREGSLRDATAFSAFLAALSAGLNATRSSGQLQAASASALAVVFALLERAIPNRTWRWMPQVALVLAGLAALADVTGRPSYQYTPFGTRESAVAFAVALGWLVVARLSQTGPARAVALIFGFCWVHQELAFASSPNVSTLLLVSWYAITGVACVGYGRFRNAPRLRHIGLGLGVIAALLALRAAWGLESTGARIGAYLVVAVFLLGIAWWYRQPGPAAEPAQ
ncbi:MAG: DUF2339 domain-containing protein [Myxococcales bacterium]|nr:DUF2339 domain-containing protein [Myxococcales bacterium]